ncbi:unnamed protein product [Polarella glacialis]|uniref:Uncharacterized protein n=1 Tax=Polarella glacialis TaxID=89957 RepID=A0A813D7I9_POLGL|nr:unnamed protein product [Polarella glacialis]
MNSAFLQACLAQHNDILRAGSMRVNDKLIEWTPTSMACKEDSLMSLFEKLENSGEVPKAWSNQLDELLYCIMKSLSFQFALMDVLQALKDAFKLPALPNIPSDGLQYAVRLSTAGCDAQVLWTKKASIFLCDPELGKKFYGDIGSVCTDFQFPAAPGAVQRYKVEMRVPKWCLGPFELKFRQRLTLLTEMPLMPAITGGAASSSGARCPNGCGRVTASGRGVCCRTCQLSNGSRHGPVCEQRTSGVIPERGLPTKFVEVSVPSAFAIVSEDSPEDDEEELLPVRLQGSLDLE